MFQIFLYVMTLAGLIYITKNILMIVRFFVLRQAERAIEALQSLHDRVRDDLSYPFDLWWNENCAQDVTHAIMRQSPMLQELSENAPGEVVKQMVGSSVAECAQSALHFAIHARAAHDEMAIIARIPRLYGAQESVWTNRSEHPESLQSQQSTLEMVGVDLKKLESFAKS